MGLAAAVASTRVLRSLLFEITPTDPVTLGGVAWLLVSGDHYGNSFAGAPGHEGGSHGGLRHE